MEHKRQLFVTLVGVLLGFGVLMVHSASITSRPSTHEQIFLSRHLAFLAIGVWAAWMGASLPPQAWRKLAPWLFWGTVALLGLILVPGIGAKVNGAQRWFRYGKLSFQPSELAKITVPLYVAYLMHLQGRVLQTWLGKLVLPTLPLLVALPLILIQPDLGTALFVGLAGAMTLFVTTWPLRNFLLGGLLTLPALGYLILQKPYQLQRIQGLMSVWFDWSNAPYQLKQSLVTLGAGGVWGTGLGRGYQKLSFLPEANTDFVFAVIGEELGLLGTLSVCGLWLGLYALGLRLLRHLPTTSYEYHAGFVLLTQLLVQVAVNIAVVAALVPPKGIPHPLISYGGSNLLASLAALGAFLSLTKPLTPVEPPSADDSTHTSDDPL